MAQNFLDIFIRRTFQCLITQYRNLSSSNNMVSDIKKSVFISQSNNIYTNLALEDWLYKNSDFSKHHILMLWQNDPCIVIGRHQNPWLEANIPSLTEHGIQLARRNSGGGTVYHDRGNLNLTFFTPRDRYNRKRNLELITRALFREYRLRVTISSREDLTFKNGCKISGTAAKLGRPNSYHHCTLLVNVDKLKLNQVLQKQEPSIKTNAMQSVPNQVMNLCEEVPSMSVINLMVAVGREYLRSDALTIKDYGTSNIDEQSGFQLIHPTDQLFPGLSAIRDEFISWDWCYGKTPDFSIDRFFRVPDHLLADTYSSNQKLKLTVYVKEGRIADTVLNIPPGFKTTELQGNVKIITSLKGYEFTEEAMRTLESSLAVNNILTAEKNKFVGENIPLRLISETQEQTLVIL